MEIWAGPIGFTVVLTQPGLTGSHAKKGNRPHHQHPLHKAELAGELPLPGVLQFPWNRSAHHMGVQLEIRPLCPGPPPATTHSLSFCPVPQIKRQLWVKPSFAPLDTYPPAHMVRLKLHVPSYAGPKFLLSGYQNKLPTVARCSWRPYPVGREFGF